MPFSNLDDPDVKRALRWRAVFKTGAAFLVTAIVATSLGMSFYLIYKADSNHDLLDDVHKNTTTLQQALTILVDCTTPHHRCYDVAQKKTGDAVGQINQVVVLAAFCADQPGLQTIPEIEACVRANLK